MDISITNYNRSDVVKAVGRVDTYTAPQLQETFNNLMDDGRYNLVFDMESVDFLSSKGLGVLIETVKSSRKNRGNLALVNVNQRIKESFEYLNIDKMFDFYDDLTDAVGSF